MLELSIPMLSLAAVVSAFPGPEAEAPPSRPQNVVLFLVDDIGVDLVGAYEQFYEKHPHPDYPNTTPAIDYLAESGLLFTNAWTNPACSPTRAQVLTGKPGCRSGIGKIVPRHSPVTTGMGLSLFHDTIPSVLRSASPLPYISAAVGKWHLADSAQFPPAPGTPVHPLGDPANPWFDLYAGPMFNLPGRNGYNRWVKVFATPIRPGHDGCKPEPGSYCEAPTTRYATTDTADDAIHLIQSLSEPFFLLVSFNAAHEPLVRPGDPLTEASCDCPDGEIRGVPECDFSGDKPSRTRCLVQWLDNEIGRVLCAIESGAGIPDLATTIIFMGDNGTASQAKVLPFSTTPGKGSLYDGGINVPFIVKSPLVHPSLVGGHSPALVCSTDILATLADLCGAPLPDDPHGLRDSKSFMPVLRGKAQSEREYLYAESFKNNFLPMATGSPPGDYSLDRHRRAIRNQAGFKMIQIVAMGGSGTLDTILHLYDLSADPHEQVDRLAEATGGLEPYASNYKELLGMLETKYPHLCR